MDAADGNCSPNRLVCLEAALQDECNVNDIYSICQGKSIPEALRPDVYQVCLDVRYKNDQMKFFNEIYDLPFQNKLREDCNSIVAKIGNDEEDKVSVLSDLESILTFYCKNRNLQYENDNGWIPLLLPLLSLKLNRSQTYNIFEAIRDTYVPKGCQANGNVFHVFRLLLLYHDPELCTMLDTKKITPDLYSQTWFQSLFAANCNLSVTLAMWDTYFQHSDPFLIFFLGLIILINGREQIIAMKNLPRDDFVKFIENIPCALEIDDVGDFCSLALYYGRKTPKSFKTEFLKVLYSSSSDNGSKDNAFIISQALCLPVSIHELVENSSMNKANPEFVRFFLVDCRPADQYNAGHLQTAFHLDCTLMLQEPIAFCTAVQGLLSAQRQSIDAQSHAGGEHLCFMGSGRVDEDQYTNMVVASFLQKNTKYVSLLTGGYNSIHNYFGDSMIDCLEDHDNKRCIICNNMEDKHSENIQQAKRNSQNVTSDLLSRFSYAMKVKSSEVKDKFFDIITIPTNASGNTNSSNNKITNQPPNKDRHVSPTERNGRRYRNVAPIFSIDDENDNESKDEPNHMESCEDPVKNMTEEAVNLNQFLKSTDIINHFKCQEVHMSGYMYDSFLIITQTHLVVLRELDRGLAQVIVRRPLASIVKITAKKRHRDLITFKYGFPDGDNLLITDMDRFLIPNASVATAIVSKHILKTLDETK